MILKYCPKCEDFNYLLNINPYINIRLKSNYTYFNYIFKSKVLCNMFYFYECDCGCCYASEMFVENTETMELSFFEIITQVKNRFTHLHKFLNKEENNYLKIEIREYLQKYNGPEYILNKLWLLDMIADNMNSSIIVIADTKEQAKELLRVKMELESDVDIEEWFDSNGIKFLLRKAKEVDDVWSEKFPNILAIT